MTALIQVTISADSIEELVADLKNLLGVYGAPVDSDRHNMSNATVEDSGLNAGVQTEDQTAGVAAASPATGEGNAFASPEPGKAPRKKKDKPAPASAAEPEAPAAEAEVAEENEADNAETQPQEEAPVRSLKELIDVLTSAFRTGDDATKQKLIATRDGLGLKFLSQASADHLPALSALATELSV